MIDNPVIVESKSHDRLFFGWLVECGEEGVVLRDARVITRVGRPNDPEGIAMAIEGPGPYAIASPVVPMMAAKGVTVMCQLQQSVASEWANYPCS